MSTGSHRATNQIRLLSASLGFPDLFSRARAFTVRLEIRPDTRFKIPPSHPLMGVSGGGSGCSASRVSVGCGSELVSSLPSSDVYFGEGMSYLFTSDTQWWSQFRPSVCIWPIAHFSCSVYAWFVWPGVLSWCWFLWWHLTATPRLLRSLFVCH